MSNKPGRPKKKLTENQKIEILNLYFSTELSKAEIADSLKIADYRVSKFLSKFTTNKRKVKESKKKENTIDIDLIIKLREQCYSSKDIAKELNIGDKLLKEICNKNNINLKIEIPKHSNVKGKVEEILEKYNNEISIIQLAKEYKVESNVISKILKYNNVIIRRGVTKK